MNQMPAALERLRFAIHTLPGILSRFSEAESEHRPSPERWSKKEVLGHLIDSAANNHQRFVHAQFTDDLMFADYEQDQWVSTQKYRDESWPDVIDLWSSYNLHLLHVVSVIPEDVLTKTRAQHTLDEIAFKDLDKNEPATLEFLIRDYVDHLHHHLNQIFTEVEKH